MHKRLFGFFKCHKMAIKLKSIYPPKNGLYFFGGQFETNATNDLVIKIGLKRQYLVKWNLMPNSWWSETWYLIFGAILHQHKYGFGTNGAIQITQLLYTPVWQTSQVEADFLKTFPFLCRKSAEHYKLQCKYSLPEI